MAEVLHYTRAADQLYISQPSLSYALGELEKELGILLFEKTGRQIRISKYGEAFLPFAKNALDELSRGQTKLLQMSDPASGSINLGYIYSAGSNIMPSLIEKFYLFQGNRQITFNFQQSGTDLLLDKLLCGNLDVLLAAKPDIPQVEALPICQQELYLVVYEDHPLANRQCVTLEDFADEKLILISRKSVLYKQIQQYFREASLTPQVLFEVDECNAIAAFVGARVGIAIMPPIPLIESYNLKRIPFKNHSVKRDVCLLWHKDQQVMPQVKCFLDFAKQYAQGNL